MNYPSRKWSALALSGLISVTFGAVGSETGVSAAANAGRSGENAAAESDAAPPNLEVLTRGPGMAEGLLFVGPQLNVMPPPPGDSGRGPQIVDDKGRPVWYHRIPQDQYVADFRTQTYRGEKVLTWWEGTSDDGGVGSGVGYIANENYEIIATVQTPDEGQTLDLHEFRLTPQGTALVISYQQKPHDLTPVGGPKDGTVIDSVVQEIDVATGKKVLDWSSLDHVPVTDTDQRAGSDPERPFNYLHANSVSLDTDGNLLISGHGTSTVYKVDRETGEVIWRLGGRNSDFRLGAGARTIGQHDAMAVAPNVYRVFDNQNVGTPGYESRVAWLEIDTKRKTAELVRQVTHPELVSTAITGGSQELPNGNTLVGWGSAGRVSEFSPSGKLVFDAVFPEGHPSYRAYRSPWKGSPETDPDVTVDDGSSDVHAIWNGATEVDRWRVLGGESETDLKPVAKAEWNGLDTSVNLPDDAKDVDYVKAEALDDHGKVIGESSVEPVGGGS